MGASGSERVEADVEGDAMSNERNTCSSRPELRSVATTLSDGYLTLRYTPKAPEQPDDDTASWCVDEDDFVALRVKLRGAP